MLTLSPTPRKHEHFKSREKKYSLVISDVRMPGMSGIQLAKRIKSIDPSIKIILLMAFEINVRI
jgi:YesN/AraC family two-component response regulator